ncbi:GNAT family N-acetyltransferase [Roseibium denhamense]|uniref:ElaA protein n=1 Tax=Roseibium denhamense TaxID=76305 RepID=A0ABY1NB85_9HYPH|nr:GNAT family N-acetyltransferase [Roseibium denhamense]MTI06528.1 GNAT family N-acetyltransferase [Roseibium denhamense]SMP04619.1 ElaA protein [Roseibium denhamense]
MHDVSTRLTGYWFSFETLSPKDLHDLLKLRQDVFVLEQTCLYPDIDGKDPDAQHYLLREGAAGPLAGAIRMFTDGNQSEARIGRVVIAQSHRGQGLGRVLMRDAIAEARRQIPGCVIHVSAQAHLEKFYRSLGFQTISDSYLEDGIPHLDMASGI